MKTTLILFCLFFALASAQQNALLDGFFVRKVGADAWKGVPVSSNGPTVTVNIEMSRVIGDSIDLVLTLTGKTKKDFDKCSIMAVTREKKDESKFVSTCLIGKYSYGTHVVITIAANTEYLLFYSNNKNSPVLNVQELIGK